MNDFDIQRKEFMKYNGNHPMVRKGVNHIKDKLEYEHIAKPPPEKKQSVVVIQDDNSNTEEIIEVQITSKGEEYKEGDKGNDDGEEIGLLKKAKKAAVAVSGGAMVAVGIPLIPFPAPCGCVMIAGGLSVLASEFPAAQRVLDQGKEKLRDFAEYEEEEENSMKKDEFEQGFEMISNNDNDEITKKAPIIINNLEGDDPENIVNKNSSCARNGPKETLRKLTKNTILPLIDRLSGPNEEEEMKDDLVIVDVHDGADELKGRNQSDKM